MNIKINIEITRGVLEDIFITAIEGGSDYWCDIDGLPNNFRREHKGKSFSEMVFIAVYDHNMKVNVFDTEDSDDDRQAIGVLDKDLFEKRLQKMVDDGHGHYIMAEINASGDAISSDCIFQYLILNEIIYG